MTMSDCTCGERITSMGTRWAHLTGGPHDHHPWPAEKPPPSDDSDEYGPRWPRPDAPRQLPPDFWDRDRTTGPQTQHRPSTAVSEEI